MRTKKSTDILIPTEVKILAELSAEINDNIFYEKVQKIIQ